VSIADVSIADVSTGVGRQVLPWGGASEAQDAGKVEGQEGGWQGGGGWLHAGNVGRLDAQTSGALVITDDGTLTHLLTQPGAGVWKTYIATVQGQVDGFQCLNYDDKPVWSI
jgi:hypothetical protein